MHLTIEQTNRRSMLRYIDPFGRSVYIPLSAGVIGRLTVMELFIGILHTTGMGALILHGRGCA